MSLSDETISIKWVDVTFAPPCSYENVTPLTRSRRAWKDFLFEDDPRCRSAAKHRYGDGFYCTCHRDMLRRDHDRIVARIRSIPVRP